MRRVRSCRAASASARPGSAGSPAGSSAMRDSQCRDLVGFRPLEGDAPRHRVAQRPGEREVGRRAGHRVARPAKRLRLDHGEPALGEVGQLQVLEEQLEELLAGQHEAEGVLVVLAAVPAFAGAAAAPAALRPLDAVALHVGLVAGQDVVLQAGARLPGEARLAHPIGRHRNAAVLAEVLDILLARRLAYGPLGHVLDPPEEALPVGEALAPWIQSTVDDVHSVIKSPPARSGGASAPTGRPKSRRIPIASPEGGGSPRLLHPHVPLDQAAHLPLGVAARDHPARRTRRASSRSRRPSSSRRRSPAAVPRPALNIRRSMTSRSFS